MEGLIYFPYIFSTTACHSEVCTYWMMGTSKHSGNISFQIVPRLSTRNSTSPFMLCRLSAGSFSAFSLMICSLGSFLWFSAIFYTFFRTILSIFNSISLLEILLSVDKFRISLNSSPVGLRIKMSTKWFSTAIMCCNSMSYSCIVISCLMWQYTTEGQLESDYLYSRGLWFHLSENWISPSGKPQPTGMFTCNINFLQNSLLLWSSWSWHLYVWYTAVFHLTVSNGL